MILISQDKKIIISSSPEMFQICKETIVSTNSVKHFYTIRMYPTLNDYFKTKVGNNHYIKMASYTTEKCAISALEKVINYKDPNFTYTFPPDAETAPDTSYF